MANDDQSRPTGGDPLSGFLAQLRGVTEQLSGLAKLADAMPITSALRAVPGMGQLPPTPAGLTAAQFAAITAGIAAQRSSIQAMQAQLTAFDEQLAVLESILKPFADWTGTWADLERRFTPGGASRSEGRPASEG